MKPVILCISCRHFYATVFTSVLPVMASNGELCHELLLHLSLCLLGTVLELKAEFSRFL